MNNNLVEDEDLIYNTSKRVPVCICIDTNVDNVNDGIVNEIEKGIVELNNSFMGNDMLKECIEVAVVALDDEVKVVQDYTCISKFSGIKIPTKNNVDGFTDLGLGIVNSLDLLQNRKTLYSSHGVDYHRPWLIVISNDKQISKENKKSMDIAKKRTLLLEKQKKLTIITVYVNSEDSQSDEVVKITKKPKKLTKLSKNNESQIIAKKKIAHFFNWLAQSIDTVAFENEIKLDFSSLTDWEDI